MAWRNIGEQLPSLGTCSNLLVRREPTYERPNHSPGNVAEDDEKEPENPGTNDDGAANEDDGQKNQGANEAARSAESLG